MQVQVGEPARVGLKLKRDRPEDLLLRIGGAQGGNRYVTFGTIGTHRVPITVSHADGRRDEAVLEFHVVESRAPHPYPLLRVSQEPTNPFVLHCGLKNAQDVHRDGVRYEWEIKNYGTFTIGEPYFVVDSERLLNTADQIIPFDIRFAVVYPGGERRETIESFRIWNDYVWFKSRGILKPRPIYDYRARAAGKKLAASCVLMNDEDEILA